jgi:hypothetical protein
MKSFFLFFLVSLLVTSANLKSETISPIDVINNNPLIQVFGLPFIGNAKVMDKDTNSYSLHYAVSSLYVINQSSSEALLLDGEMTRTLFQYKFGVGQGRQWAIGIPYVAHSGGTLDGFINDWHDTFNLPESGRELAPDDRLQYLYRRNGQTLLDYTKSGGKIGDIQIATSWQLRKQMQPEEDNIALSINLKIPTGESENLTGSNALDFAIWVKREQAYRIFDFDGGLFYSGGALLAGKGDVLRDLHDPFVLFGGIGIAIDYNDIIRLTSQVDLHSPFYSAIDLPQLSDFGMQLTIVAAYRNNTGTTLEFGFSEDLSVDVSPDITLHFKYQYQY